MYKDKRPERPTPTPTTERCPYEHCEVDTGPEFVPMGDVDDSGTIIQADTYPDRKIASFTMHAKFKDRPPGVLCKCCEVRLYISWDEAYHAWKGGPPHSGFPANAAPNTWYEDRSEGGWRYGHRRGLHSFPRPRSDEYLDASGGRDQDYGFRYLGADSPRESLSATGKFMFQLAVIDTCKNNIVVKTSSIITIKW